MWRKPVTSLAAAWPVVIFLVLTVLVPVEFGFYIGPLFFTWSKAYLFVMSFGIIPIALLRSRLELFDWLLIALALWTFVAFLVSFGVSHGLEGAGTYVIEVMTVYLMVRLSLRSYEQMVGIIRLLFWLVLISTIVAIPEALLKHRFVHEFAEFVTGIHYFFSNEERRGLLRAASFFEHPILFGVFCAVLLSPTWFTTHGFARLVKVGVIASGTYLSLSSAPLLMFVAQVVLIMVERATRWLNRRVAVFAAGSVALVTFLQVFTGRGAIGFITLLMLDPATAWYRKAQIDYSLDDVLRHPFFGIGAEEWTRPAWVSASIDNQFIAMALRGGIPALVLFLATLYLIWRALARIDATGQPRVFSQLRNGWGLMMVALLLGGLTVTYFGRMQPLMAFYAGLGASLAAVAAPPRDVRVARSAGRFTPTTG